MFDAGAVYDVQVNGIGEVPFVHDQSEIVPVRVVYTAATSP
jgi:hypothetical protein